ncbi:hypothetical protein V6N12_044075 [Hibiscus sabdariffa]|uniref:Uncharacterized protein n=1 Tax=Hibiscus sabdariffa TaxID=183260 RepID=A0ABR2DGA5_9ROSI
MPIDTLLDRELVIQQQQIKRVVVVIAAMAYLQCEKELGQGYYGGSSSWGSQSNKYQDGYSMSYSEHERHAQIRCPTYGNTESHTAHGYGKSHGTHGNAMSKPQFHAHGNGNGNGYMNAQAQAYGSKHQTSSGYGYGHGHGHGNHGTNGHGKFTNHGTPHGGKLTGHGNGFMKPQTYGGHGGNMTYGMTETETCEYSSEVYYSNESHYNSGGRGHRAGKGRNPVKGLLGKIKGGLSGNDSSSDSESDSDDDGHGKRTVCSKPHLVKEIREALFRHLTGIRGDDEVATHFMSLHLLSKVHTRVDDVAVGKLSLNLTGLSKESVSVFGTRLNQTFKNMLPFTNCMPLTLEYVNIASLASRKGLSNKHVSLPCTLIISLLIPGVLLLPEGSHCIHPIFEVTNQAGSLSLGLTCDKEGSYRDLEKKKEEEAYVV